jgi:hypothetical protein
MMANNYILTYEFEDTQPQKSEITIYETMLEQEDCLKIQEDEFHIPKPNLPTRDDGKYGCSFIIEPEVELIRYYITIKFLIFVVWQILIN